MKTHLFTYYKYFPYYTYIVSVSAKQGIWEILLLYKYHCVKSARIQSFSGPHFPAFGLNTQRCSASLRVQSECGKIRTRKTLNTGTFLTVYVFLYLRFMSMSTCKIMKSLCHYEQPSVVHNKVEYRFYSTLSLTQAVVFAIFSQKMGVICYDYMLTTMGIYLIRKISLDMPPDRHFTWI